MPAVIAVKKRAEYSGIASHLIIKRPLFLATIGKRIKPLFPTSNIILWVKKQEKRPMLSVGIIPCGSI